MEYILVGLTYSWGVCGVCLLDQWGMWSASKGKELMAYRIAVIVQLQKVEDEIPLVSFKDVTLESYAMPTLQEANETLDEVEKALMGGNLAPLFRDRSLVKGI